MPSAPTTRSNRSTTDSSVRVFNSVTDTPSPSRARAVGVVENRIATSSGSASNAERSTSPRSIIQGPLGTSWKPSPGLRLPARSTR